MKTFCIIIPAYKDNLDPIEEISLKRLNNVIGKSNYDVYLLTHSEINIDNYNKICSNLIRLNVDKYFFENTTTYSKLLMSSDFYEIFDNLGYQYIYIYQLDCYLFFDKLEYWCNKRYDYIGAPIFSPNCGWDMYDKYGKFTYRVGNGGFSLRRVSTFYHICSNVKPKLSKAYTENILNEDIFFCENIYRLYNNFFIPDWITASKFAVDMSPDILFDRVGFINFPMCAHAIGKNIRFYKYYIEEFKDQKIIDYCENKYKKFFKKYYTDKFRSTVLKTKNELKMNY